MVTIHADEIIKIIHECIEQYNTEVKIVNTDTVLQVGDGIARIYGLDEVMTSELVKFEEGTIGIALNLESKNVGVVLMGWWFVDTRGKFSKSNRKNCLDTYKWSLFESCYKCLGAFRVGISGKESGSYLFNLNYVFMLYCAWVSTFFSFLHYFSWFLGFCPETAWQQWRVAKRHNLFDPDFWVFLWTAWQRWRFSRRCDVDWFVFLRFYGFCDILGFL